MHMKYKFIIIIIILFFVIMVQDSLVSIVQIVSCPAEIIEQNINKMKKSKRSNFCGSDFTKKLCI